MHISPTISHARERNKLHTCKTKQDRTFEDNLIHIEEVNPIDRIIISSYRADLKGRRPFSHHISYNIVCIPWSSKLDSCSIVLNETLEEPAHIAGIDFQLRVVCQSPRPAMESEFEESICVRAII